MSRAVAVAVSLACPALAAAHDFWVERTPEAFVVRYGHRGGDLLPIDRAKVRSIRCSEGAGAPRELAGTASFSEKEIRLPAAPCSAVSVLHDGGYWSLTPDGEVNLPRNRAGNVVRSWSSRQYAKWVDARSPRAGAVLGDALELVPVTDLARARAGDKLTLRLLADGQPVKDAAVAIGHRPIGETDSKGEIRLRARTPGVESISASVRRPRATPEADAEVLEASLTFEVAP